LGRTRSNNLRTSKGEDEPGRNNHFDRVMCSSNGRGKNGFGESGGVPPTPKGCGKKDKNKKCKMQIVVAGEVLSMSLKKPGPSPEVATRERRVVRNMLKHSKVQKYLGVGFMLFTSRVLGGGSWKGRNEDPEEEVVGKKTELKKRKCPHVKGELKKNALSARSKEICVWVVQPAVLKNLGKKHRTKGKKKNNSMMDPFKVNNKRVASLEYPLTIVKEPEGGGGSKGGGG